MKTDGSCAALAGGGGRCSVTSRTRGRDPGGLRDQATGAGAGRDVRCEAGREVGAAYTSSPETEKTSKLVNYKESLVKCQFDQ